MKYQLNLTALSCPIPLLTAKKALANLAPNDELVLQLNRQSAVENFVVFCEENQCELVDQHWLSEQLEELIAEKRTDVDERLITLFVASYDRHIALEEPLFELGKQYLSAEQLTAMGKIMFARRQA